MSLMILSRLKPTTSVQIHQQPCYHCLFAAFALGCQAFVCGLLVSNCLGYLEESEAHAARTQLIWGYCFVGTMHLFL